MKHRAVVTDINDPKRLGRIRVRLRGFGQSPTDTKHNTTPWVYPCTPLAGPGYGLFCMPVVGDEVWVEKTYEDQWVYTGFFWSERAVKPAAGSPTPSVRVLRTPVGHQFKLEESGCLEILHTNGNVIRMEANGDTYVNVNANYTMKIGSNATISVGGNAKVTVSGQADINVSKDCNVTGKTITLNKGNRVVNQKCICAFSGMPHPQGSRTVYCEDPT